MGQDCNRMTVEGGKTRVTRKECKRERDILKSEGPWHGKGLWNIDKKRRENGKTEENCPRRKVTWAEHTKATHEDHFSSSWLKEDAQEKAKEAEERG